MDITLYGAGLALEFIALLALRIREPLRERPFRIPLPAGALFLLFLLPLGVYTVAISGALYAVDRNTGPALVALGMLISAVFAWRLILWKNPGLGTSKSLK
jgi:hypothetical protein